MSVHHMAVQYNNGCVSVNCGHGSVTCVIRTGLLLWLVSAGGYADTRGVLHLRGGKREIHLK